VFLIYQVVVCRAGVAIKAAFTWLPFAVSITTIFECKDISGRITEKFVDRGAVGEVAGVSVKG